MGSRVDYSPFSVLMLLLLSMVTAVCVWREARPGEGNVSTVVCAS